MKKNNKLNTFEMLAGLIIAGIAFGAQSQTSVHLKQTGDMASSWYDDDIWNDDDLNTPQMKKNKPHTTKVTSTAHQPKPHVSQNKQKNIHKTAVMKHTKAMGSSYHHQMPIKKSHTNKVTSTAHQPKPHVSQNKQKNIHKTAVMKHTNAIEASLFTPIKQPNTNKVASTAHQNQVFQEKQKNVQTTTTMIQKNAIDSLLLTVVKPPNISKASSKARKPIQTAQPKTPRAFFHKLDFNGHLQLHGGFFSAKSQTGTQDINIPGLIGEQFTISGQNKINGLGGMGYLFNGPKSSRAALSYGLNIYYLAKSSVSGDVYQEHLFNNLAYEYTITNIPIYASIQSEIKTSSDRYSIILDLGIGPNVIQTQFSETSIDGGVTLPEHLFGNKNNVQFSAMAGIGARINHGFDPFQLGCGYQFFYLGNPQINNLTNNQVTSLTSSVSYVNALVCTVTI